jgi:putative transposase
VNRAFGGFFRRVKAGQKAGYPRFKGAARFDSVEWPKDGDGARWLPGAGRVYLQGIGQVKVHLHRPVQGRVKTIQIKRAGRCGVPPVSRRLRYLVSAPSGWRVAE